VTWGENTTDEMYYFPLLYVPYNVGDENVVFDQTSSTNEINSLFDKKKTIISPNPVSEGLVNIGFYLNDAQKISINIVDNKGTLVKTVRKTEFFNQGFNFVHLDSGSLNSGIYFVQIVGQSFNHTDKLIINK
jgi:hypothetical protein